MSLPSFDDTPVTVDLSILPSSGSGNRLPIWLLALCGSFTAVGKSSYCLRGLMWRNEWADGSYGGIGHVHDASIEELS